jgi:hypothetical protein
MLQFGRPKRSKTCVCKCRSHCTVYNESTGQYEGEGVQVSRGDRDKHARDDKLLSAKERLSSPSGRTRLPIFGRLRGTNTRPHPSTMTSTPQDASRSDHEAQANWIVLIEKEIQWLSEAPITSHTVPLVFVNEPPVYGEYTWPSASEILQPNWGVHTLRVGHHANNAFLATENRLCELVTLIGTMEHSEDLLALTRKLHTELIRLNHEKELQWFQQRETLVGDKVTVNTGELFTYLASTCH